MKTKKLWDKEHAEGREYNERQSTPEIKHQGLRDPWQHIQKERDGEKEKYGYNYNSLKQLKQVLHGLDAWIGIFIKSLSKVICAKNSCLSQKPTR